MLADFEIFKRYGDGFYKMDSSNVKGLIVGGFCFAVGDKKIPFDWEKHSVWEDNGVFECATGMCFGHGDYQLDECFDEDYAEIGIKREDISAELLASAHHIEEFYVNFEDGARDVGFGHYTDNAEKESRYRLELRSVSFEDVDTGKTYDVSPDVLKAFNKGEIGRLPIAAKIAQAETCVDVGVDMGKQGREFNER